ncbi:D111/G-patch domain-containing protein [Striga asiatica]|uniref:D111/G-patch domain-containing protein n=1 Tax=Striga asiatica TaxID=4170 RepID=A0A5A7R5D8_STRAF|nr:D111/G-patch domain-containing protein [Striga asiatica]
MAGAGEEEDDDYMGDLSQFLPPEVSRSSSKGLASNPVAPSSSSKKPKALNWQEQKKLKRERKQIEEDKQTLENLGSAIPQSSIGFKLLKQMGYTPGSALGKEGSGRAEPILVEIRRGRAGIGKEDPKIEKARREKRNEERKKRKEEELMEDFGSRQKERWKGKRIVVNFHKADAVLAQLENRDVLEVEKKEDGEEEKEDDEEEEEITEEGLEVDMLKGDVCLVCLDHAQDLLNILLKLRNEFLYCLFCGCKYDTVEELESNCPGINEDDH